MDLSDPSHPPGELRFEAGVAWLTLDQPRRSVNTLSSRFLLWLDDVLAGLEANGARGLVIRSAKPSSFVVGADLEELASWTDSAGVERLLLRGHELLARLEGLPFPTVAAIHGACLGGGLELALACRWRVATDDPVTRLGFPEVKLGLIPGLGGTQRLPRRIGPLAAIELLAGGRELQPKAALSLGLVDELCHPADLARAALARLAARPRRPRFRAADLLGLLPGGKSLLFALPRRRISRAARGQYPAPLAALEAVAHGWCRPPSRGLGVEAESFARLVVGSEARNLVALFFVKNEVEARAASLARIGREVTRLGVVGAGFMGAGVAHLAAEKGLVVALRDRDLPALSRGVAQARSLSRDRGLKKGLTATALATERQRLRPTLDAGSLRGSQLVIEAVFEELAVKRQVLAELEAVVGPECVIASNTSALPIGDITHGCRRPERVVGMHFFSPVAKMPLLEVIRHRGTCDPALATAVALGRRLGKTVIVVGDGAGFYTTRVLAAMLNEACWCLAEGASIEAIDRAMVAWGWPVGPLTLMDEVGLDVGHHVAGLMRETFGPRIEAAPVLAKLVEAGRLGRKSGLGFYRYSASGGKRADRQLARQWSMKASPLTAEAITERCFFALVNEIARTMADGVISNPMDVDLGALFGFGFPTFRGGPLREAERLGLPRLVERLIELSERLGPRFEPAPRLLEMAETGASFYE